MIIEAQHKLAALFDLYHRDQDGLLPSGASGSSAARWVEMAQMSIRQAKYTFRKKKKNGFKPGMTSTVPLLKQVRLAYAWDEFTDHHKAVVLWHELVHVRQQRRMGAASFISSYSLPRGRWILEMQAYRMSLRIRLLLGMGTQGEPERIADSMLENYGPWLRLDRNSIREATIEVLNKQIL